MGDLPTDDLDIFHESGVFYHAAGIAWKPGQPLRCWNRLKADGAVTDAGWQHQTPVGQDGDVVSL